MPKDFNGLDIDKPADDKYDFSELKNIISILRSENGCPWDRKQTLESMKKHLTGEVEEVLEAVDKNDMDNLCEELGDVLMQILIYSQIASESNIFDIGDVIDGVSRKLIRRHPHVFGDETAANAEEGLSLWNSIKAKEKAGEI